MKSKSGIFSALSLPLLIVGGVLVVAAFLITFTITPVVISDAVTSGFVEINGQYITNKLLFSQKIFYFHMPAAIVSMLALVFTAVYGALFLKTRNSTYDMRAQTATEVALVFILMTMATGELWQGFEWGVWWTWDPRLTTYLILMLLVFGYFVLRAAVSDPERRAVYSSVFGIITFVDVPICFMITRLVPSSVHPVLARGDSGLAPLMLLPLMMAMVGFCCIAYAIYHHRLRIRQLDQHVETLKMRADELLERG